MKAFARVHFIARTLQIIAAGWMLHSVAAPTFYVMDAVVGMPFWWRVMDFGLFFAAAAFLLAFWLWPSKASNP